MVFVHLFPVAVALAVVAVAADPPVRSDPARLERIREPRCRRSTSRCSFNTPEADAILSALEVFPPDNPWNLVVEDWPVHPDSKAIVASIGADKPLRYNPDMAFVLVPPDQKKVEVKLVEYPDESDPGPYPVPDNMPIEGWPAHYTRYLAPRDAEAQGPDAGRRAARQAQRGRRPARDRRRSGQPQAVRVLPAEADGPRLAGGVRVDLRPDRRTSCGPTAGPARTRPACRSSRRSCATTS